jgi:DNA-binding transcriptional regulator YhcF (GntR family)
MLDSIQCKREDSGHEPTQFVPPDRGQKILSCYAVASIRHKDVSSEQVGSVQSVLLWLIKHANPNNGRCDPSIRKLAFETGLAQSTIKCALKVAEDIGYLRIKKRFGHTSTYHLNFDAMEADFRNIEEQAKRPSRENVTKVTKNVTNVTGTYPADASATPQPSARLPTQPTARLLKHKGESVEVNTYPERALQPSAVDATPISSQKEKGFQEEKIINLHANQTLAEREARARVQSQLSEFHSRHLSAEAFEEAVAAELKAEGSGHVIVSEAALKAWRSSRKKTSNARKEASNG